ncbi:MAG: T9SS type A sorting domain-containing protein [Chitinophagales bacterium]
MKIKRKISVKQSLAMPGVIRIWIIIIFAGGALGSSAQYIPDANFRQAIEDQCPDCIDGAGYLTAEAQILDTLHVDNSSISDITGIEGFLNLRKFFCTQNQIVIVPPLPDSLRVFYCSKNLITTLPALPGKIQEFKCENNQLNSIPELPKKLTQFYCSGNNLIGLPLLPPLLDNLTCNDNVLTSLPPLPEALTSLHCNVNLLTALPALPALLLKLYCSQNFISYLPELPSSLTVLDISGNPINCLPLLPYNIQTLNTNFTFVTCFPNIPGIYESSSPLPLCVGNSSECAVFPKISGFAFVDFNGNGNKDGIDIPVSGMMVMANTGNWVGNTDSGGIYELSAGFSNTYTIAPELPPGSYSVTPSSYTLVTGDSSNQKFVNKDFALHPSGDNYDLSISLIPGMAVPSVPVIYTVTYTNNSAFSVDGTLEMMFDPALEFLDSDVDTSSKAGYTLTWNVTSMLPFTAKSINVIFNVTGSQSPGDTLTNTVSCTLLGHIDVVPSSNSQTIKNVVVGAVQSNVMTVSEDTITPYDVAVGIYIGYTLYFQNTGATTCNTLEVFDTLSNFLDGETFRMNGASHHYDLEISNADFSSLHPVVLHWKFKNIQLPTSAADSLGSRGSLSFSIKAGSNSYQNALILNRAEILFDFSSIPVVTEEVYTLVQFPVGIPGTVNDPGAFEIYPNPFSDQVSITGFLSDFTIMVYDITGKILMEFSTDRNMDHPVHIDLGNLNPGAYLLRVESGKAFSSYRIFKQF